MRYKVGDEVVLRDDLIEGEVYDSLLYTKSGTGRPGEKMEITDVIPHWGYEVDNSEKLNANDDMINHEKTAELHKKDKALNHYQGELEKIVEQRNNDDYTKALMKYGRVEGDDLDELRKSRVIPIVENDKYARHKEITDYMHNTYVSKNKDYGDSFERTHDEIGSKAGLTRISDKFYRLQNIILNEHEHLVEDETVIDTLIDLANYAVMFAMELEEDGD